MLPPTGVVTIAGWIGGAVGSLVSAFLIASVTFFAVRRLDEWRPHVEKSIHSPDSSLKYSIFFFLGLQLFIFGTAISVDLSINALLFIFTPLNFIIALLIIADMFRLRSHGISWERTEYAFAVLALFVGILGGLGYWYRRGRKRTEWYDQNVTEEETDESDDDTDQAVTKTDSTQTQEETDKESKEPGVSTEDTGETSEMTTGVESNKERTSEHKNTESEE